MKSLARRFLERFGNESDYEEFRFDYKNGYHWHSDGVSKDDYFRTFELYRPNGEIIAQIYLKIGNNSIDAIYFGKDIKHFVTKYKTSECIRSGLKYVNNFLENALYPFRSIRPDIYISRYGLKLQDNKLVPAN